MDRLRNIDLQSERSCNNSMFISSAWMSLSLAKKEAPELYEYNPIKSGQKGDEKVGFIRYLTIYGHRM